ncbi:MAG TPA: hypothetical protein DCS67_01325 [Clostridiales bacterium UBA8960]|jgi:DNA mismatch repair ATPase MutS|nr:hypothetical protein [Clostridiales bacterium UBA8960]
MKSTTLTKKNFEDLDLNFIFERLQLSSPYGEQAKKMMRAYSREEKQELLSVYDKMDATVALFDRRRSDIIELKSLLKEIKMLDHTFDRIAEGETLSVTELFEVKQMALAMQKISDKLTAVHWNKEIQDLWVFPTHVVIDLLDPEHSGVSNFYIYSMYSNRLKAIRDEIEHIDKTMKRVLTQIISQLTDEGYPVSTSGDIRVPVRDQDLLAKVKRDERLVYKSDVPMYSLFTVKRDVSLKSHKDQLLLEEEEEEFEVRSQLTETLKKHLNLLLTNTKNIGEIDLLIAKAQLTVAFECTRPIISESPEVEIVEGRHLKVAYSLQRSGKPFTPINVSLKKSVTLITGANMGGKTVSLKLIGQVVALAHYGFFVPCKVAKLPIFDFIFISVGDFQSIDMGLSTFGGEIVEIEQAVKRASEFGLILIDELARGTNPLEGFAISKALIEHLTGFHSRTVITTHFDGLTNVEGTSHYQVKGLSSIDLDLIRHKIEAEGVALLHEYMDYSLTEVSKLKEIPKEALRISELMGLDQRIVKRAKEILGGSHDE